MANLQFYFKLAMEIIKITAWKCNITPPSPAKTYFCPETHQAY